jgi:hypothetical protein
MIICFDKSYGRYFIDSSERWRKIDEKKEENNRIRIEKEAIAKKDTEIIRLENLKKKEQDDFVDKIIKERYPLPPWKIIDKRINKSVDDNRFYTTTKNIVLGNNLLTEKEMNDIQNIPLKKGGIITLNDFEKVVTSNDVIDDYITYEEPNFQNYSEIIKSTNKLPISNYRFNEKN